MGNVVKWRNLKRRLGSHEKREEIVLERGGGGHQTFSRVRRFRKKSLENKGGRKEGTHNA